MVLHLDGDGETEGDGLRLDPFACAKPLTPLSQNPRVTSCWVRGWAAEFGFLEPGPWYEKKDSMHHQKPIHAELRDVRTLQQYWQYIQFPGDGPLASRVKHRQHQRPTPGGECPRTSVGRPIPSRRCLGAQTLVGPGESLEPFS